MTIKTKRIIIVDDDDGILDALEAMLDDMGYTVETSLDGEALLQLHKDNLPDLILLDVLLSGSDGRDICLRLKKNDSTKHVPIIMISAEPMAAKGAKECGADDFIAKPFSIQELMSKIETYMS